MASTWTQPTALRQFILAQPYVNIPHFQEHYPPREVAEVLEDLVQSAVCIAVGRAKLEEHVLHTVNAEGAWR